MERGVILITAEGDLLDRYHRMLNCPRPPRSQVGSVANFLDGNKPLAYVESKFLDDPEDLVSVSTSVDRGRLNRQVEGALVSVMSLGCLDLKVS